METEGRVVPIRDIEQNEHKEAATSAAVAPRLLDHSSMTTELRRAVWRGVDGRSVLIPEQQVPRQRSEAPPTTSDTSPPDKSVPSTSSPAPEPPERDRSQPSRPR